MWKCSLQQVGHELLYVGHVLYGRDVWSQWHRYLVHLHQTEHVRQDGRVHHQTYMHTATSSPIQHRHVEQYKQSTANNQLQHIKTNILSPDLKVSPQHNKLSGKIYQQ